MAGNKWNLSKRHLSKSQFCVRENRASKSQSHIVRYGCLSSIWSPLSLPPSRLQIGGSKPLQPKTQRRRYFEPSLPQQNKGEKRGKFQSPKLPSILGFGENRRHSGFLAFRSSLCGCKQITKLSGRTERPISANAEREREDLHLISWEDWDELTMWDQLTCVHQQSSMYLSGRVEEGWSRKGPSLSLHRLSGNCEDGAKKSMGRNGDMTDADTIGLGQRRRRRKSTVLTTSFE